MITRLAMLSGMLLFTLSATIATAAEDSTTTPATVDVAADSNYLNGGIGTEEADAIRLKAASFPLRITFSQGKDGKSIAGATVSITDSKGKSVFELGDAGPILYVKLPNGSYKLKAEYQGVSLNKNVALAGKKGANVYLNWKGSPDDEGTNASRDAEPSIPVTPTGNAPVRE
jgi:hypothetical protein